MATTTGSNWELELAALLQRISSAQRELLALLAAKRKLLVQRDYERLSSLTAREGELAAELQACHDQRQELLAKADAEGLPGGSLEELSESLPGAATALRAPVRESQERARLIRHECLAQWVAVQHTVLHLSQMLEIIATGGRLKPTYGKVCPSERGGALMDQAV